MITPNTELAADQKGYIITLALGYQMSQVLLAAVGLEMFTLLDKGPQDAAGIARMIQADETALKRFTGVLVDLKLLEEKNGLFYNTAISSRYLVAGKKGYLGNIIHHAGNLWEFWQDLDKKIQSGSPGTPGNDYLDDFPHRLGDYLSAMHESAELKAAAIAEAIAIQDFRNMLDIGCGPASYAIAFSQWNPEIHATLVDLEPNIQYARKRIVHANLQSRIKTVACQILEQDIPGSGYDLIFISNLIHIYGRDEVETVLAKAWNALSSPGSMVLHDYIMDAETEQPLFASLFDLTMFLGTPRGKCYTRKDLAGILNSLGVRNQRFIPLSLGTSLLVCEQ